MASYFPPTTCEYNQALQAIVGLQAKYAQRAFKVGRCAGGDADTLSSRLEYRSAQAIHGVWKGSKGKCATMEQALIAWGLRYFPNLCQNQQVGGGPQSDDPEHLVYAVFW